MGNEKVLLASILHKIGQISTKAVFFLWSSQKNPPMREPKQPRLVIEECPLTYEKLTNEAVKEVLQKVWTFSLNISLFLLP